jgi:hypothetical protein
MLLNQIASLVKTISNQSKIRVYFSPETGNVYAAKSKSEPILAMLGRDVMILQINRNVSAVELAAYLVEISEQIKELAGEYEGTYWDGKHHIGLWSDRGQYLLNLLQRGAMEV